MKLAYGIPLIDDMTLSEFEGYLKLLSGMGYEGVEPPICYAEKIDREGFKALLDKYNMQFSGFRSGGIYDIGGVRFTSPDSAVREKAVAMMKDVIELAGFFGCCVLLGRVQGWLPEGEDLAQAKAYIVECMRECAEHAGKHGTYIAYEPINKYDMNYNNTTKEMVAFTNHINETIGNRVLLLMDVYHMMQEDDSIAAAFIRSKELLGHVHFSDSNHGVPGTGSINFADAIKVLDALDYRGWLALEVTVPMWDYEKDARFSIAYLKPMIDAAMSAR